MTDAQKAQRELFEQHFTLGDDGTMDTVIACNHCEWEGRYNPNLCSWDGVADGGEAYDDDELDHMRIMDAYEMAAEDHSHADNPSYVTIC